MNRPDPQTLTIDSMLSDIDKGLTKIPQFQRDFVWTKEKTAKLIDSLLKGYPIGTFIIWQTKDSLRSVREIGQLKFPQTPEGLFSHYILDGQQRMTSIYACMKGAKISRDGKVVDYNDIWINLLPTDDDVIVTTQQPQETENSFIRVRDLFEGNLTIAMSYDKSLHTTIQRYRDQLKGFLFSAIMIKNVGIEIATDIFTRINTTGKDLTLFEIMVAKTYSETRSFDLLEKNEIVQETLATANYGTIPSLVIIQIVSAILKKDCTTKTVLALSRDQFIDKWPLAVSVLKSAVDYLKQQLRVPVSELLPFNPTLVVLAYFFHHHPNAPTGKMQRRLNDLFWRISLGGRYSGSVETKIAQDLRRVDTILNDQLPTYDWPVENTYDYISNNGYFSASRSYIKALLCILIAQGPLSFDTNSEVNIKNDWLKRANSKNYHHFFPKSYLKNKQDYYYVNHIANITLVDDRLNKAGIGAKKPSLYLRKIAAINSELNATLSKTHLIDYEADDLSNDNYDLFYDNRIERLRQEISKRIIFQDVDKKKQTPITADLESAEVESEQS